MAVIDIFQAAARLEGAHPFAVLTCLIANNQTVESSLQFDDGLLPLVADWLDTRFKHARPDAVPSGETFRPKDLQPELPEKVSAVARIVRRFRNNGYFGGRHTAEVNFQSGVPGHLLGFAADVRERLLHLGILEAKHTQNGRHVWLNERRLADIDNLTAGRIQDPQLKKLCDLE